MTIMTLGTLSECLKFPELGSWEPRKDIQNLNMLHVQFMIEKFKINVNAANYAEN